jgi:hypothetical protein
MNPVDKNGDKLEVEANPTGGVLPSLGCRRQGGVVLSLIDLAKAVIILKYSCFTAVLKFTSLVVSPNSNILTLLNHES